MTNNMIRSMTKPTLLTYLKIALVTWALAMLSGCRIWDMASFQWQNANATATWNNELDRTSVPFYKLNEHVLVDVSVNGKPGFVFVLDSGAAATVLTETAQTRLLKLPRDTPLTISGSGNGEDPVAYIVNNMQIKVGDFAIKNLSVIYAPTSAMPFDSIEETYFDGVLGADFFNCCLVEINHDQNTLVISAPTSKNINIYASETWQKLSIDVESNTPFLTTLVEDGEGEKNVKVMLDTGSTGTLSLFAGDNDFVIPDKTYETRTSGISGDTTNRVGHLNAFHLGNSQFKQLPTYFRFAGSNPQSGSHGVLGNRVMQRFNMVFDFAGETIWIQPVQQHDTSVLSDRSGLRLLPHKEGAIAKDIAPGTGAETLKIPVNSIVKSINGTPITSTNFDALTTTLKDKDVKSVSVCWLASSEQRCGQLHLVARI
ncbi:MAG: hypothetical protein Alis3KO_27030 [Aliiglaciecola sp.]